LKRYGNFSSAAHRHFAAASVSPDFVSLDMRNKNLCYSPTVHVCSVDVLYVERMREVERKKRQMQRQKESERIREIR